MCGKEVSSRIVFTKKGILHEQEYCDNLSNQKDPISSIADVWGIVRLACSWQEADDEDLRL